MSAMKRQDRRFQDFKTPVRMRDLEEFAIRPKSRDEERELYAGFYERLYEYFHKGRIDFSYLADRLGLRERRIRECLMFRLSSGEVMQLFGLKKGVCFVCETRLFSRETPEPVCLRCLNAFEKLLEEQYGKMTVPNPEFRGRFITGEKTGTEFRVQRVDENMPPPVCPLPEDLPDDVGVLKEELSKCRQTVAEYINTTGMVIEPVTQTGATPSPAVELEDKAPPPQAAEEKNASVAQTRFKEGKKIMRAEDEHKRQPVPIQPEDNEFLALLEMDESQITAPELQPADVVQAGEPLRHYGFKRSNKKQ